MKNVPILTTEQEVSSLAQRLLQQDSVAIDLEMDAMHSYREKICLAQVSTPEETVICAKRGRESGTLFAAAAISDLDLRTGENTLLIRLVAGNDPSFSFSPAPQPRPDWRSRNGVCFGV